MMTHLTKSELAVWGALAVGGGGVAGWIDLSASETQGPALVVMLVAFGLTLPGRAPVLLVAVATALAVPVVHVVAGSPVGLGIAIVLVPALVGAAGGRFAGKLLDTAVSGLPDTAAATAAPWYERALSTRFLLSIALIVIAGAGFPLVVSSLRVAGHPAPAFLAIVWQIMTLLGWIGLAPLILNERSVFAPRGNASIPGLRGVDVAVHLFTVILVATVHAMGVVTVSGLLFIPLTPSWIGLVTAALVVYLPLDLLAYLAMHTLGYASDAERHHRDARQRERALRAESLDSRLSALRAKLNPHFLFNALNSVSVLARSGENEATGRLVEGLTSLLRYVLDDRRATVALGEELEFVRQYLAVQEVRFGPRLRFEIAAQDGIAAARVPQLLLQPIVENAVEHGVSRTLDGGTVRLAATHDGDRLRIVVEDNGPGPGGAEPSFGIGLTSTRERLAHLYGDRASLTLESPLRDGPGTRVEISLPFETHDASA